VPPAGLEPTTSRLGNPVGPSRGVTTRLRARNHAAFRNAACQVATSRNREIVQRFVQGSDVRRPPGPRRREFVVRKCREASNHLRAEFTLIRRCSLPSPAGNPDRPNDPPCERPANVAVGGCGRVWPSGRPANPDLRPPERTRTTYLPIDLEQIEGPLAPSHERFRTKETEGVVCPRCDYTGGSGRSASRLIQMFR
jgi:hypothetical protein